MCAINDIRRVEVIAIILFTYSHFRSFTQPSFVVPSGHGKGKKFRPSTAAVLRLLRLTRSPSKGNHPVDDELLGDEGEEEFRGSSVAFASSPSDSEEEEEEESTIPTRPTLR